MTDTKSYIETDAELETLIGAGNRYLNMRIKDAAATGMVATHVATVMGL